MGDSIDHNVEMIHSLDCGREPTTTRGSPSPAWRNLNSGLSDPMTVSNDLRSGTPRRADEPSADQLAGPDGSAELEDRQGYPPFSEPST